MRVTVDENIGQNDRIGLFGVSYGGGGGGDFIGPPAPGGGGAADAGMSGGGFLDNLLGFLGGALEDVGDFATGPGLQYGLEYWLSTLQGGGGGGGGGGGAAQTPSFNPYSLFTTGGGGSSGIGFKEIALVGGLGLVAIVLFKKL